MQEYGRFSTFYTAEEAQPLLDTLAAHNIPFKIEKEKNQLDAVFIGGGMERLFVVSIPVDAFSQANEIVRDTAIDTGNNFADEPQSESSYTPEHLNIQWIIFGYILSLFMFAGILGGLAIIHSTKRLPSGQKVKMYDQRTIMHGRIMIGIGILSTCWWLARKAGALDFLRM